MKQVSEGKLEFLINKNIKKTKKEKTLANIAYARTRREKRGSHLKIPYKTFYAPTTICIEKPASRKDLTDFIINLKEYITTSSLPISIDFKKTKNIYVAGAILFLHEISVIKQKAVEKKQIIKIKQPHHHSKIDQVLSQIGFYELFNIRKKVYSNRMDVIHWRVINGTKQSWEGHGEVIEKEITRLNISKENTRALMKGLSEALTNTNDHAYPEGKDKNGWYIFFQFKDDKFFLIFSDLGVGIRETIRAKSVWDTLKKLVSGNEDNPETDSEHILLAAQYGKTQTGQDNRGKGIPKIVAAIKNLPNATVSIYSDAGSCRWGNDHNPSQFEYSEKISGTIVCWDSPIERTVLENL